MKVSEKLQVKTNLSQAQNDVLFQKLNEAVEVLYKSVASRKIKAALDGIKNEKSYGIQRI
ncbi:MAG: hypothetical protein US62_C0003G0006 [Candidatus Woesebacteria bacterium GW2011_GWA1_37_8]|uniref:Uncharacterized protein n=2 Tax=Candidatus Woeseibacteriota TaxID=1752722 RepID=A0A0G0PER9_9BACT|nr:MAG: hypothetical protein US39_C0010G0005 [Microgenomates group bacterium GW2011_GWC1_37_12b]KKQ46257.1 MAG: hypothetical protein US62_C0003G0006 [Candidatus Woesebacteria bacterium GW2011_GWA1_37_8]KKQ87781.1 MAG: hypothetical protein UT10_C0001G0022 [Candidatus Woesebacteria bacterium GW2011_GWB1_38_8b]